MVVVYICVWCVCVCGGRMVCMFVWWGVGVKLMTEQCVLRFLLLVSRLWWLRLCYCLSYGPRYNIGIISFSKLSLATAIMALTPVSCYCMTSFNYGAKEARDVGLTYRCHLSNIMPDSIFNDSIGWGIAFFFKGW